MLYCSYSVSPQFLTGIINCDYRLYCFWENNDSQVNFQGKFFITCCIPNAFLVLTLKNQTLKLCVSLERGESWLCQHSQEPGIAGQQLWEKSKTLPVFLVL